MPRWVHSLCTSSNNNITAYRFDYSIHHTKTT